MAYERIKTEMKGDTSRWGPRALIKQWASRLRRVADRRESAAGLQPDAPARKRAHVK